MAAGLVVPVSGPYVGTWGGNKIGTLSDDGYELACTIQGQEVNETDAYGMTLVEAIYRGQNWRARLRGLEWLQGMLNALQMFGQFDLAKPLSPEITVVGDRWTRYCAPMVLNAIITGVGSPTTPLSLTATNSGIAPNSQSAFNMTSKVRELPLELCLIPYASAGSPSFAIPFTVT